MSVGGIPGAGPFRGLAPYDETSAALFFGRAEETSALLNLVTGDGAQVTALTGEPGVGKTSLLRAGLVPALARHGVLGLYLGAYDSLDQELWQAASRARADNPTQGENPADLLVRLARTSRSGTLLVLDHLERLLQPTASGPHPALAALGSLLASAASAAGPRLRFLFCLDAGSFQRLDALFAVSGLSPVPGGWRELDRLDEGQVAQIIEQTVLQTGTFFEAGLAALIAGDLCRRGPCLPIDLQIVARMVIDLRLTALRRYERTGGAALLTQAFFDRIATEAGGRDGRRVLVDLGLSEQGDVSVDELAQRTRVPRETVDRTVSLFVARGLLTKREGQRTDRYVLAHPRLAERIREFAADDTARAQEARRALRRRVLSGGRLSLPELRNVRAHLGAALDEEEASTVGRSVRRAAFNLGLGVALAVGLLLAVFFDLRGSYSLAFDPDAESPNARVVVRMGRPNLSFLFFLPSSPPFGAVLADTGFSASGMARDLGQRIASGRANGTLERESREVPGWLQTVVNGLRPVPRGVALVLLGDPNGVVSLKQAFADPVSRREALETLAVIGTGGAGEDEILAAALTDGSSEIRRRAVEVAAAIDRRQGKGAHANVLRSALGDRSFEVRSAVLRECATLETATSASVLSVALADKDAAFRRLAENAVLELARRSPAAAADTVRVALRSPDARARMTALGLLDQIAARAPEDTTEALTEIVADDKAPEEARVAALGFLRRSDAPPAKLQATLEKATGPEASPRLRAAALPLYARLLDPIKAEELAIAESKGPPASRAVGAAIWGAIAGKLPDSAAKALKSFVYDPSPEVRAEAARAYGYLRREGVGLIQKALLDPNTEVQRAAVASAVMLAPAQPYAVPEALGRSLMNVRPGLRRTIVEALGQIGQHKPAMVMPPLARALKEGDGGTRATAAGVLCSLAGKNAAATAPYLRLAARDTDRDVRTAAASCLGSLAEGDPRGAARIATELAAADEASVRAAAASSLGALAPKAREMTLAPLFQLAQDRDRAVRMAAVAGLAAYGQAHAPLGKRAEEVERALAAVLAQGDAEERQLAIRAAAGGGLPGLLRQAIGDADEMVRLETVRAAATMKPPVLEIVRGAVEDRSLSVRTEAIRRLATVSDAGAEKVLPVFEAMLRSGDPATRRAGAAALGELTAAGEKPVRLLAEALRHRGEGLRTAAAEALGRIAERDPERATSELERALADPAYDVRTAATRALGGVWARRRAPADLADLLVSSERDSARRFVALEALALQARGGDKKEQARQQLERIAAQGPPLARLAARLGRAFVDARPGEMHAFVEKLLGG